MALRWEWAVEGWGHSHPLPPATFFKMRLRPRLKDCWRKRHEGGVTWRMGNILA